MKRWNLVCLILILALSSCNLPGDTGGVTPNLTATTQTDLEPTAIGYAEEAALQSLVASLASEWPGAQVQIDDSAPPRLRFVASQEIAPGDLESAEIVRYPSGGQARLAFGDSNTNFHGFEAQQGSEQQGESGQRRWLAWLDQTRIYRVETLVNAGEARDPGPLAERLFQAAVSVALLSDSTGAQAPPATEPATVAQTPTASNNVPLVNLLPDPNSATWAPIVDGFLRPLLITHAGDWRLFVVEQRGVIWVMEEGSLLNEPFLDIRERVNDNANEQGLLGLAFHPQYAENGRFFINHTDANGDTVVAQYLVSASDRNLADRDSEQVLLQIRQPYANHNGGHMVFGPDGYLYIGTGDGGSANDPQGNGQSLDTLLGKILRIDVDLQSPYAIPPDNPFIDSGQGEIWAYGLRNPWRFSFDPQNGDLYLGDVGQNRYEEVDFLAADAPAGANFGWNRMEGAHPFAGEGGEGLINPVVEYANEGRNCSVTGGVVVHSQNLPNWDGVYLFADYCGGDVWGLVRDENGIWQYDVLYETGYNVASFGQDFGGEVYLVHHGGAILRLEPAP